MVAPGFPVGTQGYDQELYSVMSANQGPKTNSGSDGFGHVSTPMAFDIAAIQAMYGPNTSYRTGSDTYVLPDTRADGTSWQCIWDAGGTDTIRYNGNLSATIDLRAATLVNGDPNAGGFVSQAAGIFGGYTIANGVVIENAIGGTGNDTLVGNAADKISMAAPATTAVVFPAPGPPTRSPMLTGASGSPGRRGTTRFRTWKSWSSATRQ